MKLSSTKVDRVRGRQETHQHQPLIQRSVEGGRQSLVRRPSQSAKQKHVDQDYQHDWEIKQEVRRNLDHSMLNINDRKNDHRTIFLGRLPDCSFYKNPHKEKFPQCHSNASFLIMFQTLMILWTTLSILSRLWSCPPSSLATRVSRTLLLPPCLEPRWRWDSE